MAQCSGPVSAVVPPTRRQASGLLAARVPISILEDFSLPIENQIELEPSTRNRNLHSCHHYVFLRAPVGFKGWSFVILPCGSLPSC